LRLTLLIPALVVAAAAWLPPVAFGERGMPYTTPAASASQPPVWMGRQAPSFDGATAWLNSPPLTLSGLRGKVVLVDFWTYTCINWRREFPYVRAWAQKYKEQGLVVIGVHSPEFGFEKDVNNVRRAVQDIGVPYPVATDSDHAIWRAFGNAYWPALYFIDAQGRLRHRHFGEGDYEGSEKMIQQLLREAGATAPPTDVVSVGARGAEAAADWANLRSPENYLGSARTANFESPGGVKAGKPHMYTSPERIGVDHWALEGDWTVGEQAAISNAAGGRVIYRFHARSLHLVMGPSAPSRPVRFRVLIDGKPAGDAHGIDISAEGTGTVTAHRMYQLIRQPNLIVDRKVDIEFLDPGVEIFAFTFG
jgi:thiol-disulfide isomerase/thioredoxin